MAEFLDEEVASLATAAPTKNLTSELEQIDKEQDTRTNPI